MKSELNYKKIIFNSCIVLGLTILFCLILFNNNIYVGDDLTFHLNRIAGLANAFEEGQILPKIYPYANYGFGYATPLFYCDIFLYPFAILYHFGIPAVICFKMVIFTYTLIGNIVVFILCKKVFKDTKISILGVTLYLFANYHIQNAYIRSALGEILALTWIPLVIYSFYCIFVLQKDSYKLLGISFSLLLMSHLISTLLFATSFFILIIIFTIKNIKQRDILKKMYLTIIKGTILAIFLSAWYLFPMLEQMHSQTFWLDINKTYNNLNATRQNITNLFSVFACTNINSFDSILNTSMGIMLLIVCSFYLFTKKKTLFINSLLVISIIFYLMIFGFVPLLPKFEIIQFLFRFYVVIVPFVIVVGLYALKNISNKNILVIIAILFSIINQLVFNKTLMNDGEYYLNNNATLNEINSIKDYLFDLDYNHDELGGAEYLPYTEYMDYKNEDRSIKTIDENGNKVPYTYDYYRNFTKIEVDYDDNVDRQLIFPLNYYKGYKAYEIIDGKKVEVPTYNYEIYKLVFINASSGKHKYVVSYEGTMIQKLTLVVSTATLLFLVISQIRGSRGKNE